MLTHKAQALSASDFQAARIIDDGVFFNSVAMDPTAIKNFLDSKLPTCDSWGTQPISSGSSTTRAQWAAANGKPQPPYYCLKDYGVDVPNMPADSYCTSGIGAGHKTSYDIIAQVSIACNVSPKVLLVLLQKEQSLVTDDWPWPIQYQAATGFGCPDTAACDQSVAGFFNQVYYAARQYQKYAKQPMSFNYRPGGTFNILYNPNSGCGSSSLYLQNQATAGLYNYTPYQPNDAALSGLSENNPGGGDGCSAYGNRNFWWYFSRWFGTTYAAQYSAQEVWQSVFTDSTKTNSLGWGATLVQGQTAYAVVQMKNTGNITWTRSGGDNDTRLATYNPWGRQSSFCTENWVPTNPNCTRAATLSESSVAPGQVGTFEFPLSAPGSSGSFNEHFGLVVDGKSVFSNGFINIPFTVLSPDYSAEPVWQSVFTDSTKATSLGWNATLGVGQNAWAVVKLKNTSNFVWTKNGGKYDVRLATYDWGRISPFCAGRWITTSPNCTRAATLSESSVAPGQVGTFEFPLNAPTGINTYNERFGLVVDGKSVFRSGFVNLQLNVTLPTYAAQPVWQSVFTDSTKATSLGWNATLAPNQSAYVVLVMKNTSNFTWTQTGSAGTTDTRLATYNPWGRQSSFCTGLWISCNRPVALKESSVAPGQNGTFEFPVKAPAQSGIFNEGFGLVVDGKSAFGSGFANVQFTVQ